MKIVLFLFVAAFIAGGAALYGLFGSSHSGSGVTGQEAGEVSEESELAEVSDVFSGTGPLIDLMTRGGALECRISYESEELSDPVTGTYFVSGKNIRGDFEVVSPELGSVLSSVIMTDTMFYSWSEIQGQLYGVKTPVSQFETIAPEQLREPIPSDEAVDYECFPWTNVDGSIFIPPGEVLFQDVSSILEAGMEYGTIYNEEEL